MKCLSFYVPVQVELTDEEFEKVRDDSETPEEILINAMKKGFDIEGEVYVPKDSMSLAGTDGEDEFSDEFEEVEFYMSGDCTYKLSE